MTLINSLGVLVVLAVSAATSQKGGVVTVEATGTRSLRGHTACALWRPSDSFLEVKAAYRWVNAGIDRNRSVCVFEDVPAGTYAVSIFHDENDNGALDTGFLGTPEEGYGFSNGAKAGAFGPPGFDEAAFAFDGTKTTITIGMAY